ncbi:hypothetical protein COO20_07625 [Thalassospira marina]|uniref:Uncharacterized protein n=1 Tax=Thalassospira marina TaxID=2048283 RepID=A0A2N3KVS4_9PROT|nr:hypothetical protein COO20_07625 [Thalassospira marina]
MSYDFLVYNDFLMTLLLKNLRFFKNAYSQTNWFAWNGNAPNSAKTGRFFRIRNSLNCLSGIKTAKI